MGHNHVPPVSHRKTAETIVEFCSHVVRTLAPHVHDVDVLDFQEYWTHHLELIQRVAMSIVAGNITPLILDFLEWVAAEPRPYADVMDAWRTSCPRLTVWEDSVDRGLVTRRHDMRLGTLVELTADGLALLTRENRTLKGKISGELAVEIESPFINDD